MATVVFRSLLEKKTVLNLTSCSWTEPLVLDMTFFLNLKFLKSRLLLPSALKFSTIPETIYDRSSADSLVVAILIS